MNKFILTIFSVVMLMGLVITLGYSNPFPLYVPQQPQTNIFITPPPNTLPEALSGVYGSILGGK
jgi:hypothetical protein